MPKPTDVQLLHRFREGLMSKDFDKFGNLGTGALAKVSGGLAVPDRLLKGKLKHLTLQHC